ncbi:MAG: ATP-binding protein [Polynucleobacter sp.]
MTFKRFLCLLVLTLSTFTVIAGDFVTQRGWVEDPSGKMTLEEAQQAVETPLNSKLFTQGYSHSTYWIRLRIDPNSFEHKDTEKLVVRLRPPYQDQIQIFDPLAPKDKVRITGDHYDWSGDEYRSLNLNFIIPVGSKPRDIWLKLKASVSTLTFIEVMTEDQVRAADRRQEIATMLYLSVLFLCFGWAALSRINKKDKLLTYYLVREVVVIAYALAILGYLRVFASSWLPTYWLDLFTNLLGFIFPAVVIWFDSRLIGEFKPNRWLARIYIGLLLFLPIAITLVLLGRTIEAARFTSIVIIAAIFLAIACTISTRAWVEARNSPSEERPVISKGFLVFLYVFVAAVILLHRLPIMGSFSGSEYFVYLNLVYPLLTSVTLMTLIQVRLYRLSKIQEQKQHLLELAKIEARTERVRRIEQANFLKMLAHEMKTPLSVVRVAIDEPIISDQAHELVDRAVSDMDGIIERLLQVERLEDQEIKINHQELNLAEMVRDVCLSLPGASRVRISGSENLIIHSDQQFLRSILANLLENALKYSPNNSYVDIVLKSDPIKAYISIINEPGVAGFPDSERVFEKYYRAELAHHRTGSGLGLYLVKALVGILGGRVRYILDVKKVQFELELPLHHE